MGWNSQPRRPTFGLAADQAAVSAGTRIARRETPMTELYRWLRGGVVTMGAAAMIAYGSGIARAEEPSLLTVWSGHGRSLHLAPDGTGTLSLVSATALDSPDADGEKWSVTWKGDPTHRVGIALASVISRSGAGLGLKTGDPYVATLQDAGAYSLMVVRSTKSGQSVLSCTVDHDMRSAPNCGQ